MMKENVSSNWIPGIESENQKSNAARSLLLSFGVSILLFFLLPISEFAREDEWIVREIESAPVINTVPPESKIEKKIKKLIDEPTPLKNFEPKISQIQIEALSAKLEIGPGDYKTEFSLNQYNPVATGFGGELVFSLHELDRNPNIIKRGILRYPPLLKRKGLEGEVKLLIQIDEIGKVKVLEVVSFTHPDFIEPSRKAAEGSVYEPPTRNGEKVKVQFYLPVKYNLLN